MNKLCHAAVTHRDREWYSVDELQDEVEREKLLPDVSL